MILVAKPELIDPLYAHTVLVVAPLGGDVHIGFFVTRPTDATLGDILPDDGPSQKVRDPVYVGGPVQPQLVFALVEGASRPSGKALALMPGLYAAIDGKSVDSIIREQPHGARFVSGFVAWGEGELADEIKAGAWYVLAPDAGVVLREAPEHLWQDLERRSHLAADAI